MQQLTESHKLARNSDPATSHLAAERVHEFAPTHIQSILRVLFKYGPLTVDQIAKLAWLDKQAVNKRLPDMARKGLATPTGDLRPSDSGRMARVWGAA